MAGHGAWISLGTLLRFIKQILGCIWIAWMSMPHAEPCLRTVWHGCASKVSICLEVDVHTKTIELTNWLGETTDCRISWAQQKQSQRKKTSSWLATASLVLISTTRELAKQSMKFLFGVILGYVDCRHIKINASIFCSPLVSHLSWHPNSGSAPWFVEVLVLWRSSSLFRFHLGTFSVNLGLCLQLQIFSASSECWWMGLVTSLREGLLMTCSLHPGVMISVALRWVLCFSCAWRMSFVGSAAEVTIWKAPWHFPPWIGKTLGVMEGI